MSHKFNEALIVNMATTVSSRSVPVCHENNATHGVGARRKTQWSKKREIAGVTVAALFELSN